MKIVFSDGTEVDFETVARRLLLVGVKFADLPEPTTNYDAEPELPLDDLKMVKTDLNSRTIPVTPVKPEPSPSLAVGDEKIRNATFSQPEMPAATGIADVPTETDPRGGVELDANGTPWIESVHATTKGKNKDGTWKKRRGVEQAEVDAAETKARQELAGTPEPAPQPEVAAPELTGAEQSPVSMAEVTAKYQQLYTDGTIQPEQALQLYADLGINPQELGTNETARRAVFDALVALENAPDAPAEPTMPGMPGV